MNITLSLDDDLVREVRKIAAEQDTTLAGPVRNYLRDRATVPTPFPSIWQQSRLSCRARFGRPARQTWKRPSAFEGQRRKTDTQ